MQMLLVARSRLMCCSRVWIAMRSAGSPAESRLMPMRRPGILRTCSFFVAKNAACGPPRPIGTPKRCALPTTTSAPHCPGGVRRQRESGSAATTSSAPAPCTVAANAL